MNLGCATREDDMGMVTGEQPRLLEREPARGLEVRALGAGARPTRVVPDPHHMAVGARLAMAAERSGATLHDGTGRFPDMGGQQVGLLVSRKRVLEDGLKRHEGYRCLRTRLRTIIGVFFSQYHVNYPRCKR